MLLDFISEFLMVFSAGFLGIFIATGESGGLFGGIVQMFNVPLYIEVFNKYKDQFTTGEKVGAIAVMVGFVLILLAILYLIVRGIIKLYRRCFVNKSLDEDLLTEVNRLNKEIQKKDKLLGLCLANGKNSKAAQEILEGEEEVESQENKVLKTGESRFYKLTEVDRQYSEHPLDINFDNEITLEQFCDRFRNWACSEMKLFYEPRVIRLFFAAFATTRIIILQGISGTGKTSLPYAIGQWLDNPATIASVQPSWRDRTEIFGYFNEFTKRFNETQILKKMYEARWNDQVYLTVIDEANIARVEYYFAELLSILEMPSRENWIVDICPSGWDSDPKYIEKGRFKLPENMWFVCTINNDDSTFAISDKVYDRAIPININSKGIAFEVSEEDRNPDHMYISYKHLEAMFKDAQEKYKVSEENIKKFDEMDNYVIEHFRLAFGNRIVKQLKEFVPVYVACGGTEIDGLDYVLCNKILRKFESLNLAYIRDEVDGYIQYLNDHFGEENMTESKEYLERLKKLF